MGIVGRNLKHTMRILLLVLTFGKSKDISKGDVSFLDQLKIDQYSKYHNCIYKSESCVVRENTFFSKDSAATNDDSIVPEIVQFESNAENHKSGSFKLRSKNERNLQLIRNEREVLSILKHSNILPMIASYQEESPSQFGLLFKKCTPVSRSLGKNRFIDVFYAIAKALRYMHKNDFCHLSVTIDSILYCDKRFYLSNFIFANQECHRLPEYCPKLSMYEKIIGNRRDVYMLGQTMNLLFHNAKDIQTAQTTLEANVLDRKGKIETSTTRTESDDFGTIMLLFQMTDPESKITIEEVLENPIFIGRRNPFSCCF